MKNNKPTILIIFGVSGDLAKRYVLPAVEEIAKNHMLPEQFQIVGLTRQAHVTIDSVLEKIPDKEYLHNHMDILQIDVEKIDEYQKLRVHLEEIERKFGAPAEFLFYLSIPPEVSKPIIEFLGTSMLSILDRTKLLLEKPFGIDLGSALDLAKHIEKYFTTDQVYRVDHYMAKETAQNIVVFRDGNSLFKKTWNKDFIEKIDIIASEEIDIEGRANFYEQTGALRDIVQSHLLQLLALVLMKLPEDDTLDEVPSLRLEALKHLSILNNDPDTYAKCAQYEDYKNQVKNPSSRVETFVTVTLESNDPLWAGVPLTLTTGKGLKNKFTEIRISYKKNKNHEANELILRLQPEESIQFNIWAKRPGYEHGTSSHHLQFKFKEHYDVLPKAYEQVLFSAINTKRNLFTSTDEVNESWRILDVAQKNWEKSKEALHTYRKGSTVEEVIKALN